MRHFILPPSNRQKTIVGDKYRFYRRLMYKDLTPLDGRQPIQKKFYHKETRNANVFYKKIPAF